MDFFELRVFETVARHGNMNRAAAELNTVQSNVTARIRNLEHELGVKLFERHSRGVEPTSAGMKLLPYAVRAMAVLSETRAAMRDRGRPAGPLSLGSLETVLAMHLSELLGPFAVACPDVDLSIRSGTTAELIELVLAHQLEGAFVCGPVQHAELEAQLLFHEELALISATNVESLDEILALPRPRQIVLRHGCSYRQRLEEVFARRGIVAAKALEFATLEAIFACVAAAGGISLMPHRLADTLGRRYAVRFHRLPRRESEVLTVFVRRRNSYVSSAQRALLETVTTSSEVRQAAG
jgi:DNA-binding transcriptional LysR family regulator